MPLGFRNLQKNKDLQEIMGQDIVGLIEPGIEIEGRMKVTSGIVRVNGHFKGEIHSVGIVVLADQGEVEGEVHSSIVSVAGKLKGSIHAAERVEIKPHGVVLGDIFTPSLVVDPGGYFDGQCHMPVSEGAQQSAAPAKQPAPRGTISRKP